MKKVIDFEIDLTDQPDCNMPFKSSDHWLQKCFDVTIWGALVARALSQIGIKNHLGPLRSKILDDRRKEGDITKGTWHDYMVTKFAPDMLLAAVEFGKQDIKAEKDGTRQKHHFRYEFHDLADLITIKGKTYQTGHWTLYKKLDEQMNKKAMERFGQGTPFVTHDIAKHQNVDYGYKASDAPDIGQETTIMYLKKYDVYIRIRTRNADIHSPSFDIASWKEWRQSLTKRHGFLLDETIETLDRKKAEFNKKDSVIPIIANSCGRDVYKMIFNHQPGFVFSGNVAKPGAVGAMFQLGTDQNITGFLVKDDDIHDDVKLYVKGSLAKEKPLVISARALQVYDPDFMGNNVFAKGSGGSISVAAITADGKKSAWHSILINK
jgi:hypothetical protein